MRKILAIMLAMLMLIGSAALAEGEAAVLTLDNVTMQTQGQNINIQGLSGSLVLENINNLPSIALLLDGDSQPLVTAVAQLSSSQFSFAIDGMDHGYVTDIPAEQAAQLAQFGDEGMAALLPLFVPMLDQLALPAFSGIDIPKLDMTALLGAYMTGSNTFEIPADQVTAALDQVLQVVQAQAGAIGGVDEITAMLDQMKANDIGLAIAGTIDDDGASQTVSAGVCLAMGSTVTDQELLHLAMDSTQNNFQASLSAGDSGDVMTANLTSDPDAGQLQFNLDIAGQASLSFALLSENGLQKAVLNIGGAGQQAIMEFAYGQQDGADLVSLDVDAGGEMLSVVAKTTMGSDGVRTGTLTLDAQQNGESYSFGGDLTMYTGDAIDLSGFTMPSDLRPIEQMDNEAIGNAFAPVMDYIGSHAVLG